ncbi:MAG: IMP dehydrogenase [Chloroflexota bacterium]
MAVTTSRSGKNIRSNHKAEPKSWEIGPQAIPLAFSYDDVLLVPRRTTVTSRRTVDVGTLLSRNIRLNMPTVSANMDTVTESAMATELARQGGIGIIHRFLTIEAQAAEVLRVKRAESFVISQPYTIAPDETIERARLLMERRDISGLVVIDEQGKLAGMVSARDVRFVRNPDKFVHDVMTPRQKLVTAPADVSTEEARELFAEHKVEKLPLVDANTGQVVGLITAKDLAQAGENPRAVKDRRGRLMVGAAIGVMGEVMERSAALLDAGADVLVVDVAHGHAETVIEVVKALKEKWHNVDVVAGNVATAEGAADLIAAGVDAVKVGVGPGSACTTRIVTGAGVPQLTAVMECAAVCHEAGVPLIADGGIKTSGDIAKALAAGASTVMIGSLLAGTDESPGQTVTRRGQRYKTYRGMASLSATTVRRKREREMLDIANQEDDEWLSQVVAEGVEAMVPYRGPVREVLLQLVGGLRSGMSYCNAHTLPEFWQNARFVRITPAGLRESGPHDIVLD